MMTLGIFGMHHARHFGFAIGPIILFLLLIVLIWMAVSRTRRRGWGNGRGARSAAQEVASSDSLATSSAERILSERFAKGEIALDEYRLRLVALREAQTESDAKD